MSESNEQIVIFKVATTTLLKIVGIIIALWFIYLIRDILIIIFIAGLLASAFDPFVTFLQKRRIPRPLGIIILYLGVFSILTLLIALLIPPLSEQIGQIASNFPSYWEKISDYFIGLKAYSESQGILDNIKNALNSMENTFSKSAGGIFIFVGNIFGNIISFILVLVLTFYFLVQEDAIKRGFRAMVPEKYHPYLVDLIGRMQQRLVQWLRGELLLGLIIGFMVLVGLKLLGIRYFLVLALIAGFFELIPYIGPVLGAIPGVFLAFMQSPLKGLAALILYWLIQQLENYLIVPKVMQRAISLNPIVIIIVILIGAKIAGFVGVLLAVPTAAAFSVLVKDIFSGTHFDGFIRKDEE